MPNINSLSPIRERLSTHCPADLVRRTLVTLGLCAGLAHTPVSYGAQQNLVEEILVTTSLAKRVGDTASVTAIGAEDLDLLRPTHINETLSRVAGAWVSRGSGQEHLRAICSPVLTGAGACETGGFVLGFEAFEDNDLQDNNPNPEAFRDAWSLRASSRWQTVLGDALSLSVTPYLRGSRMEFFQHFLPGQPLETNDQISGGVIAELTRFAEQYSAPIGVTLEFMDGSLKEDQDGPTIGSAFLMETRPEGLHYDYHV